MTRPKLAFHGPEHSKLSTLLEDYLFALSESCHRLFGPRGERAMYSVIGKHFVDQLERKRGIRFNAPEPYERYCDIIETFTSFGFYQHVELRELGGGQYAMLEKGQYAADVWEEQGAWERGQPPCPLWSALQHSLGQIKHTIVLDAVEYRPDVAGFYSEFHFEKIEPEDDDVISRARTVLRGVLLPICANCKKVRDSAGQWHPVEGYLHTRFGAEFTHSVCPGCAAELYPELRANAR